MGGPVRCGGEYPSPGLEIMPKRVKEILPIGDDGGPVSISESLVEELARDMPVVRPKLGPGDAMLSTSGSSTGPTSIKYT